MEKVTIMIHRRDLRMIDNMALNAALAEGVPVLSCFIFDPRQVEEHPYRSEHALQFMIASLEELAAEYAEREGTLYFFNGEPHEVVSQLQKQFEVVGVHVNTDYTPFAQERDEQLKEIGVPVTVHHDTLLTEPGTVLTQDGTPYEVYTPFRRRAQEQEVSKPKDSVPEGVFYAGAVSGSCVEIPEEVRVEKNEQLRVQGGRKEGLRLLGLLEDIDSYRENRDFPAKEETSLLSAHHKFGTVSIRETYWRAREKMKSADAFVNELYWRDFYTHIAFHFPKVFGSVFKEEYQNVVWDENREAFEVWCRGETGFPIVDAGMRELNTTGYMHNRVRMIVASFLTKDLHLPWQWGEQYFATKLTDYDPSVNNGSWQWAASTGADGAPYFRIFNPWLQQKRFDPDCIYIKKWIPELKDVAADNIHKGEDARISESYPCPMVNHQEEVEEAKRRFKAV